MEIKLVPCKDQTKPKQNKPKPNPECLRKKENNDTIK